MLKCFRFRALGFRPSRGWGLKVTVYRLYRVHEFRVQGLEFERGLRPLKGVWGLGFSALKGVQGFGGLGFGLLGFMVLVYAGFRLSGFGVWGRVQAVLWHCWLLPRALGCMHWFHQCAYTCYTASIHRSQILKMQKVQQICKPGVFLDFTLPGRFTCP